MHLLIVEDNIKINNLITSHTRNASHTVQSVFTVEAALTELKNTNYDVIITDLMLPKLSGEALIETIRKTSDVYIIVISAKVDPNDKLNTLKLGADDYLTKPFSIEELLIKLENLSKRIEANPKNTYHYNNNTLIIHPFKHEITLNSNAIPISKQEHTILLYLAKHPYQTISRDQLLSHCFNDSDAFDRMIDVYIKNLRKKLNDSAKTPAFIKTIYGSGYQFIGDQDA